MVWRQPLPGYAHRHRLWLSLRISLIIPLIIPLIIAHAPVGVRMLRAVAYWLVDDDLAVTYLDVEQALGVAADPRLEVNWRALAPEIREWHQIALPTPATTRKRHVHAYRSLPQPHPVVHRSHCPTSKRERVSWRQPHHHTHCPGQDGNTQRYYITHP
jgi:hypothetical protein